MNFKITLNGVTLEKQIPDNWQQVTFMMYLQIMDIPNDEPHRILAALTGVDEVTLNKAKIVGLDKVLQCLSFMRTSPMDFTVPETILGHKVPKNLQWESTGQFKDCQSIAATIKPVDGNVSRADQEKYLQFVAIYTMPNYLDATMEEQEEFAKQFNQAPCEEVLAIGNFTLLKLIALKLNIKKEPASKSGPMKRWRQAFRLWRINTALTLRFYLLRRKLGSARMKY